MKKVVMYVLVCIMSVLSVTVSAEMVMNGLYDKFSKKQYEELTTQITENMKYVKDMNQTQLYHNILLSTLILENTGKLSYTDAIAKIEESAKSYGLTDPAYLFLCKFYVVNSYWNGQKSTAARMKFEKENIKTIVDLANSYVHGEDMWHWEFMPVLVRNGYSELALEYGLKTKAAKTIEYAAQVSPEKTIEVANILLFKGTLSAKEVEFVLTTLFDTCYDVKYNAAITALLENADNKFYPHIGKSADWKTVCTLIRLRLGKK